MAEHLARPAVLVPPEAVEVRVDCQMSAVDLEVDQPAVSVPTY